jgi:hypothetical protein
LFPAKEITRTDKYILPLQTSPFISLYRYVSTVRLSDTYFARLLATVAVSPFEYPCVKNVQNYVEMKTQMLKQPTQECVIKYVLVCGS